jgi:hypothetical protein
MVSRAEEKEKKSEVNEVINTIEEKLENEWKDKKSGPKKAVKRSKKS